MSRLKKLGQVDLFSGRVRAAPAAPERSLHIAVADTLRRGLAPGWLWFHPANGEYRSDATGGLLKRMGVHPGVSDFILIGPPAGRVHALELKRKGLKPRPEQWQFMGSVRAAGGAAEWCDSYEMAFDILKAWGALTTRIHPQ